MKVSKTQLLNLISILEWGVKKMEEKNIDEISTRCNTYGMRNFISFGSDGFLNLDTGFVEVDGDDDEY